MRKNGNSAYLAIPRLARLELKLFVGDWVDVDLDTDARVIIIRPAIPRTSAPMINMTLPDMMPMPREVPGVELEGGATSADVVTPAVNS